ncbi:hypothetical protein ABUE34_14770 (plasmid) [Kozakia baliensis]|uniref:hypothetical protein n=1 Tax=Kozakia baliensis TaxID=153496 RepID=UPI00345C4706
MKRLFVLVSAAPFFTAFMTDAAPPKHHVVSEVSGYTCMMLKLTDAQRMDFAHAPQFKTAPTSDAANVAPLTGQVAIRDDVAPENGYAEAINFAGRKVWAATTFLAPYHVESEPNTTCHVVKYSDNTYGFTYRR